MIRFVSGDFFDHEADVMVNTVNCVGVMGAGVALAFKKKFPAMYESYRAACKAGAVRPGCPQVWIREDMLSRRLEVVNFPTKDHWRNPSEYSYVEAGLVWLADFLKARPGKLVTLPALGCGNGGLDWEIVKSMIEHYLGESRADILVFEPASSRGAAKDVASSSLRRLELDGDGIGVLSSTSALFPNSLRSFTESDLYVYPKDCDIEADYALICSTKPDQEEVDAVREFVRIYSSPGISFALGASVYDREVASLVRAGGGESIYVLPSGIVGVARKMRQGGAVHSERIVLVSTGDPFESYDKKSFIPSVVIRMLLSRKVIFFTQKLTWVSKHSLVLSSSAPRYYYRVPAKLSIADERAVLGIGAIPLEFKKHR